MESFAIYNKTSYMLSEILFLLTTKTDSSICLSMFFSRNHSAAQVDSVKTGNGSQCVNVEYSRVWKPSSETFPG